jgi:HK97 family phage prohead protease
MDNKTETVKLADVDPDKAKKFAQRLHRKKDEIEITRKSAIVDVSDPSDDERTIVARVSTPDRDRDGEIVEPKGIDLSNYQANSILLWAHDYKMPPIGRALWSRIDSRGLLCKFQFAETAFADEIYTLYRDGFLKTFSIGFIPVEFDGKTKTHSKVSLLEVSAVPVPANPNALVEASAKGLKLCDSLKRDLGLDGGAVTDTAIAVEPTAKDTTKGANAETKIMDAEGNPSVSDIWGAIDRALNPGAAMETSEPSPWYAVHDVFPVDFPSGHCVFTEYLRGREVNPTYRQDYTFADGAATLTGERSEVVVTYADKAPAEPETKEAPAGETVDLAAALAALNARLDGIESRLAPAPAPASPPNAPLPVIDVDIIELEDAPDVLEITDAPAAPITPPKSATPASITEADVLAAIDRLDLQSIIKQNVDLALDKLRGRVR